MADIAKGFAIGYGIGERAYNAYQQADEQRRIKAIQNAQTEQSYSPDDLARLQGLYNQQQEVVQQYQSNAPVASGLAGQAPGTQANFNATYDEAGAQAEMARRGLIVNPNVSPAGQVQGFNYGLSQRGMGADRGAPGMDQTIQAQQGIAPRAAFLGQQYDPSALTPEKMNSLRYGAMADVIGGRDPAGALRMRSEIRQNELRDEEAGRQRQLFPGQLEEQTLGIAGKKLANTNVENELQLFPGRLTGQALANQAAQLGITSTQLDINLKQGNLNAGKAFSTFMADAANAGKTPSAQEMYAFANTHGADPAHVMNLALGQINLDEKTASAKIKTTLDGLGAAAAGGTPTLNKFLADKFDPDANDGISPQLVGNAKTGFRVMYGDKPLPGYEGNYKSIDEVVATVQGRIKGDPLGAALTISKLDTDKAQRAYYETARAQAAKSPDKIISSQMGFQIDPKSGERIQVISGLRQNKQTGEPETFSLRLTGDAFIPQSAFDPTKIAKRVEQLVGTPMPGAEPGGKQKMFTEDTAAIYAQDEIINIYIKKNKVDLDAQSDAAAVNDSAKKKPAAAPAAPAVGLTTQQPVTTNLGPDPNRSRGKVSSVTGQPFLPPPSVPNLVEMAGQGLNTARDNYVLYLKTKIANNQPLTVDENNQAVRYKLK
jgi:hypothetical protein